MVPTVSRRLASAVRSHAVFMQINNVLIYVLLAAGVGKILLGEWLDAR